jgi:hypothetical protein
MMFHVRTARQEPDAELLIVISDAETYHLCVKGQLLRHVVATQADMPQLYDPWRRLHLALLMF